MLTENPDGEWTENAFSRDSLPTLLDATSRIDGTETITRGASASTSSAVAPASSAH